MLHAEAPGPEAGAGTAAHSCCAVSLIVPPDSRARGRTRFVPGSMADVSDQPAYRPLRLDIRGDPCGIGPYEILQELPRAVIDELAIPVEQLVRTAEIRFRLGHRGNVEENERLTQMVIRSESAHGAGRRTNDGAGLAVPDALAVRS